MQPNDLLQQFLASGNHDPRLSLDLQIQHFLDELNLPKEIIDAIANSNAMLEAYGVAPGLEVGSIAPDFELPNAMGRTIRLSSLLHKGPVILSFFRGEWCSFCNLELIAYQSVINKITEIGGSLIAITPQTQEHGLNLIKNLPLSFHILSDVHQESIIDYGLHFTIPEVMQDIMLNVMNLDLTQHTANGTWEMTVPATYIIDQEGIIRKSYVSMDFTTRLDPVEAVEALNQLKERRLVA